jgi:hypothetical protein
MRWRFMENKYLKYIYFARNQSRYFAVLGKFMASSLAVSVATAARRLLGLALESSHEPPPEESGENVVSPLALTISTEFLTLALLTAVTTGMIAARSNGHAVRLGGPVKKYLPEPPAEFRNLVNSEEAGFFSRSLTLGLEDFYAQLTEVRQNTPLDAATWATDGKATSVDWPELGGRWLPLCRKARLILLTLCECELLRGTDQDARLFEIEGLAKNACYGGTPCIRADGMVMVPGWLDHRRDTRIPVGTAIWIHTKSGRHRAVLKDVSAAGFGLSACPSLTVNAEVVAELPSGTTIHGVVVWSHGGNIGLRLADRLSATSPVFRIVMAMSRNALRSDSMT